MVDTEVMMDGSAMSENVGGRPGDWQCPNTACHNHTAFPSAFVYGSKVNCPKCGTGKSATRAGDWCCPNQQCVNHHNTVYGSKPACNRCGMPKPELNARGNMASPGFDFGGGGGQEGGNRGGVSPARPGDWHCPNPQCKNHTDNVVYAAKTMCPICGTDKPSAPVGMPPPAMGMGMGAYGSVIAPRAAGPMGPMNMAAQQSHRAPVGGGRPGDWHCSTPECKNHQDNVVYGSKDSCPMCGASKAEGRPAGGGMGMGGGGIAAPIMPMQQARTFQPAAPKWGGQMNPGGVAPARPGDWNCSNPSCKNHTDNFVFASKPSCPICGSPKPAGGGCMGGFNGGGMGAYAQPGYGGMMGAGGGQAKPMLSQTQPRPGDWQCPNTSCRNHLNFCYSSKTTCNLCGSERPTEDRPRSRSPH